MASKIDKANEKWTKRIHKPKKANPKHPWYSPVKKAVKLKLDKFNYVS